MATRGLQEGRVKIGVLSLTYKGSELYHPTSRQFEVQRPYTIIGVHERRSFIIGHFLRESLTHKEHPFGRGRNHNLQNQNWMRHSL